MHKRRKSNWNHIVDVCLTLEEKKKQANESKKRVNLIDYWISSSSSSFWCLFFSVNCFRVWSAIKFFSQISIKKRHCRSFPWNDRKNLQFSTRVFYVYACKYCNVNCEHTQFEHNLWWLTAANVCANNDVDDDNNNNNNNSEN